jgi:hypothetical protein
MRPAALAFFLFCIIPGLAAQQLIHARAGLITFAEGTVLLGKMPFQFSAEKLEVLENGQVLQTVTGRAEVQLGPGSSLWMAPGGSIRMVRSALDDTVVQIERGEIFIEIAEKYKNNLLSIRTGESEAELKEKGRYSFKESPGRLCVHQGKARLLVSGKQITVKKGKAAFLEAPYKVRELRQIGHDPLSSWAAERSRVLFQPILLARRMEAARQQMENLRYWREMEQMREQEQLRMQQEMQLEQMRQQQVNR